MAEPKGMIFVIYVLIVDDDFNDLTLMKNTLTEAGYSVEATTNESQALNLLNDGTFDLALIDINILGIKGTYLAEKIRQSFDPKMKIAYVSIVPEKEVDMKGVDAFIQKPFDSQTFLRKVNAILKGKK
jgi:DNA-binding response OmpR family regulator